MYNPIITNFSSISVLVIGDLIIDKYLHGISTRINPEAPVPVVDVLSQTIRLGGAGNTAVNLRSLGAKVTFYSVVGDDEYGNLAMNLLSKEEIDGQLIFAKNRITMAKTRVIAENQIVVRYDIGTESPINEDIEVELTSLILKNFGSYDAIVISDYNKGIITETLIAQLKKEKTNSKTFIAVDSKRLEIFKELAPSLVKPNYSEIVSLLNLRKQNVDRRKQISELGSTIYKSTNASITAVTLDSEGSIIFEKECYSYWCPSHNITPHHSSGAGDTYFSALLLSILSKAAIPQAAEISSTAARIGLEKETTSFCTKQELGAYLSLREKYISCLDKLCDICSYYEARGKNIVFTNGCFDIIHSGHVDFLNRSKEYGQILIIGLNTDESIFRLKGYRPLNSLKDRIDVLSGFGAVDHIVSFGDLGDDTASSLIEIIRPNFFTKGDDCTLDSIPETTTVREQNGEVIILPTFSKKSTSDLIQRISKDPKILSID